MQNGGGNVERARLICLRNRGELSEGWYDPSTLQKAVGSAAALETQSADNERPKPITKTGRYSRGPEREGPEESDSDEEIGPTLPGQEGRSKGGKMGPSIPSVQDLELKKGKLAQFPACNC